MHAYSLNSILLKTIKIQLTENKIVLLMSKEYFLLKFKKGNIALQSKSLILSREIFTFCQ